MMPEHAYNSSSTEPDLIHRIRNGDLLAAEMLAERHRARVVAAAYRILGNHDDANDVAQEVLISALQRLPDLRDPEKFAVWLRHITLSLCADYRRRRKTRRIGEPLTALNEAMEEQDYAWRLTVREALASISENHRITLLLHYIGGWSLEEVAEILTIPVNTVRSRLMAAKKLLRADLHSLIAGDTLPRQGKRCLFLLHHPEPLSCRNTMPFCWSQQFRMRLYCPSKITSNPGSHLGRVFA
jgi:RNA polymerase sigma-70 factor (ECF subfamily)